MILIIRESVKREQIEQISEPYLGIRIKLSVDVEREIIAGGGELHYDCEQVLLEMAVARKTFGVLIGILIFKN